MADTAPPRTRDDEPPLSPDMLASAEPSPAGPLVYGVVAVGLVVCLVSLLLSARGGFGPGVVLLALLLTVPYLVYARLALARPGVEAVAGGVLLLAVGSWGAVGAIDDRGVSIWVLLATSLVLLQLAVFALGALLRLLAPAVRRDPRVRSGR